MTDFNGLSAAEIILKRDELLKLTYDVYKKHLKQMKTVIIKRRKHLKVKMNNFFARGD